ncbi:hypothetical protein OQA88_7817 [Cercophora sp. LCS_1]
MDAPEEDLDIKLQKISGDLIAEFDKSLPSLLRKSDGSGGTVVRSRVRTRETDRLISSFLDPFQELPQLLDPSLPKWLPQLGDAFLEYHHQQNRGLRRALLSTRSDLLTPLPTAICRLLYTFCKVRGEKVTVRFLSNETRHLEPLLSALEEAERRPESQLQWSWEERYIVLLWLSHLMFAPFDLSTISSTDAEDDEGLPVIQGFSWPSDGKLPGIAVRILPLAIKYLAVPGKERDAAKALLVRISMRKDMQQLGVLDALIKWSVAALQVSETENTTPYYHIGVLSFIAGVLSSSASTSDMDSYLSTLFDTVHQATTSSTTIPSSALARKTTIKVIRSIAILLLRNPSPSDSATATIEETISFLLESLSDNDTPVRLAASKALSVITLQLPPDMASQVVEAVLDSLSANILRTPFGCRDLSAVNPLEWHGLTLTLSHLLYRRSPPPSDLLAIVSSLLTALAFERRSPSGTSTGTNVRDAACFGIWALARRYTTKELLAVQQGTSILQTLATELIVSACLDPAGNIRRGSSAALQELIGRHPDMVEKGIWVVQTVDYHAVALRSRALREVALAATRLAPRYGEAILDALLGWRGVGDVDAQSRRAAGQSFGSIAAELAGDSVIKLKESASFVLGKTKGLQTRQAEERHGLWLSFAALLDELPGVVEKGGQSGLDDFVKVGVEGLQGIMEDCQGKTFRKPELIAEAASMLIISAFPLLQAATLGTGDVFREGTVTRLLSGPALLTKTGAEISLLAEALGTGPDSLEKVAGLIKANVHSFLFRPEEEVIPPASEAGLVLLIFCGKAERERIIREWSEAVRHRPSGRASTAGGFFSALVISYSIISTLDLGEEDRALICDAILERWATDKDTDTRVLMLRSLTGSELLEQNVPVFLRLVAEGLDDYTTNARGDVGSLVRFRAVKATKALWERLKDREEDKSTLSMVVSELFLRILRLSAEKLDRVRAEAQTAMAAALAPSIEQLISHAATLRTSTFSSRRYFGFLLELLGARQGRLHPAMAEAVSTGEGKEGLLEEQWMDELMAGFVSSADTGNEDLVIATRAALCDFCEQSDANNNAVCTSLARNLKRFQGQDRVLVPTLEVIAFLFHVAVFGRCVNVDCKNLCLQVQKAGYKTGNVRKLEACVRVYGAVAALDQDGGSAGTTSGDRRKKSEGAVEARKRLGALMFHPWPRIRSLVVDELWGFAITRSHEPVAEKLKGVDWGTAGKPAVKELIGALTLD